MALLNFEPSFSPVLLLVSRILPSTSFCMLEIFPVTNRWWKGTEEGVGLERQVCGRGPGWALGIYPLPSGPFGRYYADIRQTVPASDQEMNSVLAELSRVRPPLHTYHLWRSLSPPVIIQAEYSSVPVKGQPCHVIRVSRGFV